MKIRVALAALAVAALVAAQSFVVAEDKKAEAKFSAKCPVSGKAAVKDCTADFNGGKVHFCCGECKKAFEADSKKFAAKANQQMVATGQLKQVGCPFSGKECNADTVTDVGGVKVCFCCKNCQGKVAAAKGDAQIEMVFGNISKGFKAAEKK